MRLDRCGFFARDDSEKREEGRAESLSEHHIYLWQLSRIPNR